MRIYIILAILCVVGSLVDVIIIHVLGGNDDQNGNSTTDPTTPSTISTPKPSSPASSATAPPNGYSSLRYCRDVSFSSIHRSAGILVRFFVPWLPPDAKNRPLRLDFLPAFFCGNTSKRQWSSTRDLHFIFFFFFLAKQKDRDVRDEDIAYIRSRTWQWQYRVRRWGGAGASKEEVKRSVRRRVRRLPWKDPYGGQLNECLIQSNIIHDTKFVDLGIRIEDSGNTSILKIDDPNVIRKEIEEKK